MSIKASRRLIGTFPTQCYLIMPHLFSPSIPSPRAFPSPSHQPSPKAYQPKSCIHFHFSFFSFLPFSISCLRNRIFLIHQGNFSFAYSKLTYSPVLCSSLKGNKLESHEGRESGERLARRKAMEVRHREGGAGKRVLASQNIVVSD